MAGLFQNIKSFIVHTDQDARHRHSVARKRWEAFYVLRKVQVEDLKMSVDKLKIDERINMEKLKQQTLRSGHSPINLDDIV